MAAIMDPHDNMRSRDLSKVSKGQQATRPAHEPGTISAPPPPSSTKTLEDKASEKEAGKCYSSYREYLKFFFTEKVRANIVYMNWAGNCYSSYRGYVKCTKQKGEEASECKKFADNYISNCPLEWIGKWEEERKHGLIHNHV